MAGILNALLGSPREEGRLCKPLHALINRVVGLLGHGKWFPPNSWEQGVIGVWMFSSGESSRKSSRWDFLFLGKKG